MKNINKVKRLVKDDCAGYSTENNYCCSVDGACLFFRDNEKLPCCRYFEEGILPLDKDLEYEYRQERQMGLTQNRQIKPKVKCQRCSKSFDANSNRQHFCESCKKINDREKTKLRMKKAREKGYDVTI